MIGKTMNDVEAIELNIEAAKKLVAKGEALGRLHDNKDFQALVMEGHFKEEAARVTQLKAAPHQQDEKSQASLLKQIDAIGTLFQYFITIEMRAEMARNAITDSEEELAAMAEEGVL